MFDMLYTVIVPLVWFDGISTLVGYLMSNPFLYIETVLFQAIQFSVSTQFSSIWPMGRTLSGATIPDQSGPGSNDNEGVLHIPQSSSISGASPSNCLVSYPGHLLEEFHSSAEMQSMYSAASAALASSFFFFFFLNIKKCVRLVWLMHNRDIVTCSFVYFLRAVFLFSMGDIQKNLCI